MSFEELYATTYTDAKRIANNIVHDANMVDDIIQAAAVYVVANKKEVNRSYWLQLVRNRALNARRAKGLRQWERPSGDAVDMSNIEARVVQKLSRKKGGVNDVHGTGDGDSASVLSECDGYGSDDCLTLAESGRQGHSVEPE